MRSCHSVQMKEKCNQFLSTTFQICGSISGGNAADDGRGAGAYGYRLTTNINTPPYAILRTDARRGAGVGAHTPRRRAAGLSAETSDVVSPHPSGMGLTLRRHRNGSHRARLTARG